MQRTHLLLCLFFISCNSIKEFKKLPGYAEIQAYQLNRIDTLVEIGCQNGLFSREIARVYPHLFLVLEDLKEYDICTKRAKKCTSHNTFSELKKIMRNTKSYPNTASRYKFVEGEPDSIPLPASSYSRVLCRRTLHEFTEPEKMIKELYRVLRKDGILTIVEAEPRYLNQVDLYCNKKYLTKEEIIQRLKPFRFLGDTSIKYLQGTLNVYNFAK